MDIMRGGASIDIFVKRIRMGEIVAGTGEAIPVVSGTPHNKGAGGSNSVRRRCCMRHSGGEGCCWWFSCLAGRVAH